MVLSLVPSFGVCSSFLPFGVCSSFLPFGFVSRSFLLILSLAPSWSFCHSFLPVDFFPRSFLIILSLVPFCWFCHSFLPNNLVTRSFLLSFSFVHSRSFCHSFLSVDFVPCSFLLILFLVPSWWFCHSFLPVDFVTRSFLLILSLVPFCWLCSSFVHVGFVPPFFLLILFLLSSFWLSRPDITVLVDKLFITYWFCSSSLLVGFSPSFLPVGFVPRPFLLVLVPHSFLLVLFLVPSCRFCASFLPVDLSLIQWVVYCNKRFHPLSKCYDLSTENDVRFDELSAFQWKSSPVQLQFWTVQRNCCTQLLTALLTMKDEHLGGILVSNLIIFCEVKNALENVEKIKSWDERGGKQMECNKYKSRRKTIHDSKSWLLTCVPTSIALVGRPWK